MNPLLKTSVLLLIPATFCLAEPPQNRGPRKPPPPSVEKYLNHLEEKNPDEFKRMTQLRKEDPQSFRMELRKKANRLDRGGKKRGPKGPHPLAEEIQAVRSAEGPEAREEAIALLREKVNERVEKNLEEREEAIEKFREKLKQLEDRNQQERASREEVVDHHLKRILDKLDKPESPLPE
jgi:hypothetical protein